MTPIALTHHRIHFTALPPLTLYVHTPWCVKKCPYCDFNSHELKRELNDMVYVDALLKDLESVLPQVWGRRVHAVFIGGGTPSLFSGAAIDVLLAGIRARLLLEADAEITLEANPGTVEAQRFASYAASGVNRISLGIQSFDDAKLQALGRIHGSDEAHAAIETAKKTVGNFNIDLMYALPHQTAEQAVADICAAISHAPPHLSAYQLTLEPNTLFARYPPALPGDDATAEIEDAVHAQLLAAGYGRYEISAFAQTGRQCKHNLNYWHFGDYIGIGAGAHGKLSFHDRVVRTIRHKQPKAYLEAVAKGNAVQQERVLHVSDMPFEFMLNALRLTQGVEVRLYAQRTGLPLTTALAAMDKAQAKGLLQRGHVHMQPTALGLRFLNDLTQLFLQVEKV